MYVLYVNLQIVLSFESFSASMTLCVTTFSFESFSASLTLCVTFAFYDLCILWPLPKYSQPKIWLSYSFTLDSETFTWANFLWSVKVAIDLNLFLHTLHFLFCKFVMDAKTSSLLSVLLMHWLDIWLSSSSLMDDKTSFCSFLSIPWLEIGLSFSPLMDGKTFSCPLVHLLTGNRFVLFLPDG